MTNSISGKNVLITGATSGIGLVTARELAVMGANVTIVGRNKEKCEIAVREIKSISSTGQIDYICADLSNRNGVKTAANEYLHNNKCLDVLVNNAGGVFMKRLLNDDGIEMTFGLNHLGYFYLTYLLKDLMLENKNGRIINVSSDAHRGGQMNFQDIQQANRYSGFGAYSQSKLANLHFSYYLAKKYADTHLTCNALHPGFVDTGFGKNNGKLMTIVLNLMKPFQTKVDEGAETSIFLASSPEVEGISGRYYIKNKIAQSSPQSYDFEASEKLWKLSLEYCKIEEW